LPVFALDGYIAVNLREGSYTQKSFDNFIEFKMLPNINNGFEVFGLNLRMAKKDFLYLLFDMVFVLQEIELIL